MKKNLSEMKRFYREIISVLDGTIKEKKEGRRTVRHLCNRKQGGVKNVQYSGKTGRTRANDEWKRVEDLQGQTRMSTCNQVISVS